MNIFFHSLGCHFVLMKESFAVHKLLSFIAPHLLVGSINRFFVGVKKWRCARKKGSFGKKIIPSVYPFTPCSYY